MINGRLISDIASLVLQSLNATGVGNPGAVCMDGRLVLFLITGTLLLLFVVIYTKKHKLPFLSSIYARPPVVPSLPVDKTALLEALSQLKNSSREEGDPPPSPGSSSSSSSSSSPSLTPPPAAAASAGLFSPRASTKRTTKEKSL